VQNLNLVGRATVARVRVRSCSEVTEVDVRRVVGTALTVGYREPTDTVRDRPRRRRRMRAPAGSCPCRRLDELRGVMVAERSSSAAYGHSLGQSVAPGYVTAEEPGLARSWYEAAHYEIELACERYPARVSLAADVGT
jgi:glycine cleavage system aminomethyltransferase T